MGRLGHGLRLDDWKPRKPKHHKKHHKGHHGGRDGKHHKDKHHEDEYNFWDFNDDVQEEDNWDDWKQWNQPEPVLPAFIDPIKDLIRDNLQLRFEEMELQFYSLREQV